MKKYFLLLLMLLFVPFSLLANNADLGKFFNGESGCFILYDLNQHKVVAKFNPKRCAERLPPQSTFKIALSLMAFDQQIITQETIFTWDGHQNEFPLWNHNQTPNSWLKNSVVWVSQQLTRQMGMNTITHYLDVFHYGNQNFAGDPGKNNGLERAWLSSSLAISADEQLTFLKAMLTHELPVSANSIAATQQNMYLETSKSGWKLYGKTGSGSTIPTGWFIGFIQKADQTYIFVTNLSVEMGGKKAKRITTDILGDMGLF